MGSRSKPRSHRGTSPGRQWKGNKKAKVPRELRFTAAFEQQIAERIGDVRKAKAAGTLVQFRAKELEAFAKRKPAEPRTTRPERRKILLAGRRAEKKLARVKPKSFFGDPHWENHNR